MEGEEMRGRRDERSKRGEEGRMRARRRGPPCLAIGLGKVIWDCAHEARVGRVGEL